MHNPTAYNQGILNILHALPKEMQEQINKERIELLLSSLTPREEHVIRHSFGIGSHESLSTYKIAAKLGIPQPTIALIVKKAKKKMRP